MKRLIFVLCLIAFGFGATHAAPPFDADRHTLYTPDELWAGYDSVPDNNKSLDWKIYMYFDDALKYDPALEEIRQQRRHDAGIEYAVNEFLNIGSTGAPYDKRVVVIMGSHSKYRSDARYGPVARLAWELSRNGYFVASGGGPGLMEAAHLGAYMAPYSEAQLDEALGILGTSKESKDPMPGENKKKQYEMPDYWTVAQKVVKLFPNGGDSLGIPTWFYGHEGANAFSLHVAKYLSNSSREEKMCAIGSHGVIFAPGGPGTMQEVFMDAAENAYHSYNSFSPMIFFTGGGDAKDVEKAKAMEALMKLAPMDEYLNLKMVRTSAEPAEIIDFLNKNPPKPKLYR